MGSIRVALAFLLNSIMRQKIRRFSSTFCFLNFIDLYLKVWKSLIKVVLQLDFSKSKLYDSH